MKGAELFELNVSVEDALKSLSNNFEGYIEPKNLTEISKNSVSEYLHSESGKSGIDDLFAPTIRALKCEKCGHLLKTGRIP